MDKTTRAKLNWELVYACGDLARLNRTRGPLGHGIVVHVNLEEKRAALREKIASLREQLGK